MAIKYTIDDLVYLMERLRTPETGCPWDLKQSFDSIIPHTIEETYEVVEAIDNRDYDNLQEELGDLLFQVIFYAQLGKEENQFDFDSVTHGIVEKLIRRHPHVFPDGDLHGVVSTALSDEEIKGQWDKIKQREKQLNSTKVGRVAEARLLDDVPMAMPAIHRAYKLQKKASKVGFDWGDPSGALEKVIEELNEYQQAASEQDKVEIEKELGDLLFAVINLCRLENVDPESALRLTNQKFVQRFNVVEEKVSESGKNWRDHTLHELDTYWDWAKQQSRK